MTSTSACHFNGSPAGACDVAGPGGATASANGSAVLADAAGSLTITSHVFSYTNGNIFAVANASVDLTISGTFMTSGSGQGFLLITSSITASAAGSSFSSVSYSLGSATYSCTANPLAGCNFPQPVKVPITLGLALPFVLQESANSASNSSSSSVSAANASLVLAAFLADGVTPITIFAEIPEPRTWLLMLATLALLLRPFVRRSCRRPSKRSGDLLSS